MITLKTAMAVIALIFAMNVSGQKYDSRKGLEHNKYVSDFLSDNDISKYKTSKELIEAYFDYNMSKNKELRNNSALISEFKKEFSVDLNMTSIDKHLNNRLAQLKKEGRLSNFVYDRLFLIKNAKSTREIEVIINDFQKNNSRLNSEERESFATFQSIYFGSKNLWEEQLNNNRIDSGTVATIICDAVGGALWWWTGPFGPLLAGVYSIACHAAQ